MAEGINNAIVDRWSWVHAAVGAAMGLARVRPDIAIGSAVLYDIIEYAHESPSGSVLFGTKQPETTVNIVGDLAVYSAAMLAARRLVPGGNMAAALGSAGAAALMALSFIPKDRARGVLF
jgi:hypothetical protein